MGLAEALGRLSGALRLAGHIHPLPIQSWSLCTGYRCALEIPCGGIGVGLLRSTHHTCSRKHRIVNGVCFDVTASAPELDINDDKIVDMLKVISDAVLCMVWVASPDDHVASGTERYLPSHMPRKMEMPLSPSDEYLGKCQSELAIDVSR